MNEIYKDITGFEGLYLISNLGNVISLYNNHHVYCPHRLSPTLNTWGYYKVTLAKEHKLYIKSIHVLMAEAFIPNPGHKATVDHINRIRTDNRLENLRWASRTEQANNRNNDNWIEAARATNSKSVNKFSLDGRLIESFRSAADAAKTVNGNSSNIARCANGERKTAYNYVWRWNE